MAPTSQTVTVTDVRYPRGSSEVQLSGTGPYLCLLLFSEGVLTVPVRKQVRSYFTHSSLTSLRPRAHDRYILYSLAATRGKPIRAQVAAATGFSTTRQFDDDVADAMCGVLQSGLRGILKQALGESVTVEFQRHIGPFNPAGYLNEGLAKTLGLSD